MTFAKKVVWGGFLGGVVVAGLLLLRTPQSPVSAPDHAPAAVSGASAESSDDRQGFDPRMPKRAPKPEFDKEAVRALLESRKGYGIISAARADLTKESLRDVVQRLLERSAAGDGAADRQISEILFDCEINATRFDPRGVDPEYVRRVELATAQCSQLDKSLGNSADRMLAAARAGDREARLRLRSMYNRLSGGRSARLAGQDEAMRYVRELARSGDAMAVLALAEERMSGRNLPRDPIAAYACYEMALPGLPTIERRGAEYAMQLLRQRLTDDELRQAKALQNAHLFD